MTYGFFLQQISRNRKTFSRRGGRKGRKSRISRKSGGLIYAEKLDIKRLFLAVNELAERERSQDWPFFRRSLNLFVSWQLEDPSCRRAHYTRTLSPTYLLLPPAELKEIPLRHLKNRTPRRLGPFYRMFLSSSLFYARYSCLFNLLHLSH